MADGFDQIISSLEQFDRPRLVALCSCCVTAVAPIVQEWGTEDARFAFGNVSKVITDERRQGEEISGLLLGLELLPESNEDDSSSASYYVMRALAVTYYCLAAIENEVSVDKARQACASLLDLASDVTFICSEGDQGSLGLDVATKCTAELISVVELLSDSPFDSATLSLTRIHARNLSKVFAAALPTMMRVHNWP